MFRYWNRFHRQHFAHIYVYDPSNEVMHDYVLDSKGNLKAKFKKQKRRTTETLIQGMQQCYIERINYPNNFKPVDSTQIPEPVKEDLYEKSADSNNDKKQNENESAVKETNKSVESFNEYPKSLLVGDIFENNTKKSEKDSHFPLFGIE